MTTAVLCILLCHRRDLQRVVSAVGAGVHLARGAAADGAGLAGRHLAAQMGEWPAPFGITLVADLLSAVMVVLAGIVGCRRRALLPGDVDEPGAFGYYPLFHVLLWASAGRS